MDMVDDIIVIRSHNVAIVYKFNNRVLEYYIYSTTYMHVCGQFWDEFLGVICTIKYLILFALNTHTYICMIYIGGFKS